MRHSRAERGHFSDIFLLRASAHPGGSFLFHRTAVSYEIKKPSAYLHRAKYISGTTLRLLVLFLTRTTRTGLRSLSAVPPINGGIAISQRILGRRLGSYLGHIASRTALQPVDRSLWGGVCAYSSSSLPFTFSYDRGKKQESQEPFRKDSAFASCFSPMFHPRTQQCPDPPPWSP